MQRVLTSTKVSEGCGVGRPFEGGEAVAGEVGGVVRSQGAVEARVLHRQGVRVPEVRRPFNHYSGTSPRGKRSEYVIRVRPRARAE